LYDEHRYIFKDAPVNILSAKQTQVDLNFPTWYRLYIHMCYCEAWKCTYTAKPCSALAFLCSCVELRKGKKTGALQFWAYV